MKIALFYFGTDDLNEPSRSERLEKGLAYLSARGDVEIANVMRAVCMVSLRAEARVIREVEADLLAQGTRNAAAGRRQADVPTGGSSVMPTDSPSLTHLLSLPAGATVSVDIIGGFDFADPNCKGCGKPLVIENAWMTDGCPCNSVLGVNSMNSTRWRLLLQLQNQQSIILEIALTAFKSADEQRLLETEQAHAEAARWKAEGDMYGWNFHEGRASGTIAASIIFHRVKRLIESRLAALRAKLSSPKTEDAV